MNIDVGQIIAGKYELVRLLGKGAMGEVWLATHNSLGGEFAIKLVEPADDIEAETAAGRFQLEAQIAAKLSRKTRHIVSVSDHGEENGLAYLVMELLEGESLEQRTKRVGALEMPEVAAIVLQVARALSLAHEEGIFHRDLKPANVWLAKDEDGRLLVKLLDFGIARSVKPFRTRSPFATSKDMVLGTPSYMSPEQARGLGSLDYRCDLWALAVVAYEALTKKIPFEGETVEDIFLSICTFRVVPALTRRPDLPPAVEGFFARAFAPKLADRFGTALELSEAFENFVSAEQLEYALGLAMTPSARRLDALRASGSAMRASHPSHPEFVPPPPPSSNHVVPPVARTSSPDFENVALGGSFSSSGLPRKRSGGWILAIALLIAVVGVGVFVLVTFRTVRPTAGGHPPDPTAPSSLPTVTSATTTGREIPEPPEVPSAPPLTTPATSTPRLDPRPKPPVFTGARPPPTPPVVTGRPPVTPPTAKTVDKGGVF